MTNTFNFKQEKQVFFPLVRFILDIFKSVCTYGDRTQFWKKKTFLEKNNVLTVIQSATTD